MKMWVVTLTKGYTDYKFRFDNRTDATNFFGLALLGVEDADLEIDKIYAKIEILEEK